jgi:hypothetical protein
MIYGYSPKPAVEVGDCDACEYPIYDYELAQCKSCDKRIHESCKGRCDKCGYEGCKGENGCLKEIDGLLFCYGCLEDKNEYKNAA